MELNEALKKVRTEKRYTQQMIADALNISKNTVASWEAGVRKPDVQTICKLADFYGVSTDYLLGRIDIEIKKETPPAKAEGDKRIEVMLPVNPTKSEVNTAFRALLQEMVQQEVRQHLGSKDNQQ